MDIITGVMPHIVPSQTKVPTPRWQLRKNILILLKYHTLSEIADKTKRSKDYLLELLEESPCREN